MQNDPNYLCITTTPSPPPHPILPLLLTFPTETHHPIFILIYPVEEVNNTWSRIASIALAFLCELSICFFTFGYLRLCSWAFSCTCMELYKSATRFLQLAGGCLKKCSFFIFLSPQQSTETLDCGPPTPYILYPPPASYLHINSSIFQACLYNEVKSEIKYNHQTWYPMI